MPVAALYDIHGNLPALRAALDELEAAGIQQIVFGGDVVAGPMPRETVEELMRLADRAHFVTGNADREVVEAFDRGDCDPAAHEDPAARAAAFAASQLSRRQRDFLAGFAPHAVLVVEGLGPTLFCHATPRSDTEIVTRLSDDTRLSEILRGVDERVVVAGHVHQQFDRIVAGRRVINAGSVGIPYEGARGAYWAILGPDVELRRTEYDLASALDELRGPGFPDTDEMLHESLIEPIDPDEVTRFFEDQAG